MRRNLQLLVLFLNNLMQIIKLNNISIRLYSSPGSLLELNGIIALIIVNYLQLWLALSNGNIILKALGI